MWSKHAVIIAAALWAALIYTGILPLPRKGAAGGIIPLENAHTVTGAVTSNPRKTATGTYYRFDFALASITGNLQSGHSSKSEAKGHISVLLPASILEANFPGKLYSASLKNKRATTLVRQGLLIEAGSILTLGGGLLPPFTQDTGHFARLQGQERVFLADTLEGLTYAPGLGGAIAYFRALCRLEFRRVLYAWGPAGGLFLALVSGAAEYTEPEVSLLFKLAGLAHILALSGMHLSIFSGLSRKVSQGAGKRTAELFSLVTVILFVWFAGFSPSLRRALIFFLIIILSKRSGKAAGMLEALAATFFIHTIWQPAEALTISFLLSYAGLLGILALSAPINRVLVRIPYFFCSESFAASIGAFMSTSPITGAFFGYLTPGSIIASTVISPLITLFVVSGILCVILSLIAPPLIFPLGKGMNLLYRLMIALVRVFAQIPRIGV
jgi:competence protein ComEC